MSKQISDGALSGLTIIDMSRLLPGPFCSMILADHGARVIMIEDPRFKDKHGFPEFPKRNKEHIALNLKHDRGRDVFFRLVRTADVIIEGFRPGVAERLGISYERVNAVNPQIIYCALSGFGQTGPMKERFGHDMTYLGESGLLSLTGDPDMPPSIPGYQIADQAGGGMNAVIGILLALHERNQSGKGQYIDISITDGCASLLGLAIELQQTSGYPATRSNTVFSHRYACYNTYETADRHSLYLACLRYRHWSKLCRCLERPEWINLQFDEHRKDELINNMRSMIKSRNLNEWESLFEPSGISWGKVNSLEDALDSELFRDRDMFIDGNRQNGVTRKTVGIPVKLSRTPGSIRKSPPPFGRDTESVLLEIGYARSQISEMRYDGTI